MQTEKDILRFLTCGSVDDGKSTLIGRLLFDSKQICRDTLRTLEKDSVRHGTTGETFDYALLMDGLQSEREQKITIDVAYRYFETPNRKFIIADTPGHVQYTRNMVTGASTADLAIVLVDASKGILTQTKRHTMIVSMLGIPHLIIVVNKMDLVDYSKETYDQIISGFQPFLTKLEVNDVSFMPVSALKGDNIVKKSETMPWYNGKPLIDCLENVFISSDRNMIDFRFPVQTVIRPNQNFRGYAGQICSGTISVGEEIITFPSGQKSTIKKILTPDGECQEAFPPQSITLSLEDEIDISRGNLIVRTNNLPRKSTNIDAMICWMDDTKPLSDKTAYLLKHTTVTTKAYVKKILYRINMDTLHREQADTIELNDIARIELQTTNELYFDPYRDNHTMGSFILIDPLTNYTVAAGMIRQEKREYEDLTFKHGRTNTKSKNINLEKSSITLEQRALMNRHESCVIWLTGLSGSGKSTIARKLLRRLFSMNCQTIVLDGDNIRHGLCSDLGFSDKDRRENIRRIAETSRLFHDSGMITICSFISPFAEDRTFARNLIPEGKFFEIFVKCDISVCRRRDPKGLYKKAADGLINGFTGIDSPYEEPVDQEMTFETDLQSADDIVASIISTLRAKGIITGE